MILISVKEFKNPICYMLKNIVGGSYKVVKSVQIYFCAKVAIENKTKKLHLVVAYLDYLFYNIIIVYI